MKKLILAGIVIIIGCLVFIIIQQNSSQADIGMDIYDKAYSVPFGDWVLVYLTSLCKTDNSGNYWVSVSRELIEDKVRFKIVARYNSNTELGQQWYQEHLPAIKGAIRNNCRKWTLQGYPINLNDFQFDIRASY